MNRRCLKKMIMQIFLSYLPYAVITTFTPGPNNLMSFYSVSNYGWRNGIKMISGIIAGFVMNLIICVLFCHELAVYVPKITIWLKYIGAVYMLWLAFHIATSLPNKTDSRAVKFSSGFILSITNVKVILYLITLYTAYIIPSGSNLGYLFIHSVLIFMLSCVSWLLWASAGGIFQKFISRYYRPFNIIMALLLAWCAVSLIF